MNYNLGIDIGATKSHALIADETGQAIDFGCTGPGNYEVVGWEGLKATLLEITQQAVDSAGISRDQIAGAGFGIAGYDWPSEREPTLEAIDVLGLQAPLEAVNDAIIGLKAGSTHGWGIAIVTGTGENCWGVNRQNRYGRMTGNSFYMGEYGGAGSIAYRAIRAVAREWEKRGLLILDPQKAAICQIAPGARFVWLAAPPVVGGVLLGMEQAGVDGYRLRDRLIETTKKVITIVE